MFLYRAKYVLPIASPLIEDGVVGVEGDRIAAVGRRADFNEPMTDLGERVLLPGFVNAHCHLDYTNMAGKLPFKGSFADWIADMVVMKRKWWTSDYAASAKAGLAALVQSGTTTVCDIAASPSNLDMVANAPVRVLSCLELIDVAGKAAAEKFWDRCAGLSPHAPFTASEELYRNVHSFCRQRGKIFTTHIAESNEEAAMFERAEGPLYELLAVLGRSPEDCGRGSSVAWLDGCGVLEGMLAIHANCLSDDDAARLARARAAVVHCPSSHRFYSHPPFPFDRLRAAGVPVCLGSDSAASGTTLDMRAEMREFLAAFSSVRPAEALAMATMTAAKALNQPGLTGILTAGSRADMIAVPVAGAAREAAEAVIAGSETVSWVMVDGKVAHNEL
ncbi:MAG: amidohydrolase family protein [Verrucomicrobia bacterium]|nr:amidohydrolase family protein [Verrucomicrobiota bacterium]